MRFQFLLISLLLLAALPISQPEITYIQLAPTLMPDNADTDCQALVTYSGTDPLSVRYLIWDSSGGAGEPQYLGRVECTGESWTAGKVCHSGYFDPKPLLGVVTCRFEATDGASSVGKSAVAARVCTKNCPPDCGNGKCDSGESAKSCAQDCLAYRLDISVVSPSPSVKFNRGEDLPLAAFVKSRDALVMDAALTASGFFGQVGLYDDGKHGDGEARDGLYANSVKISKEAGGVNLIRFKAESAGAGEVQYVTVNVAGSLGVSAELGESHTVGEVILVKGNFTLSGKPASGEAVLELRSPAGKLVYTENGAFSNGTLSFSYHSTLVDETGTWTASINASDAFGNSGYWTGKFGMAKLAPGSFLDVEHLGPVVGSYTRGSTISITARVKRDGKPVSGADVIFITPEDKPVEMWEVSPGVYGTPYTIKKTDPLGAWTIIIRASMKTESGVIEGSSSYGVSIAPSDLSVEIMRPERGEFEAGGVIEIVASAKYPDGEPVNATNAFVTVESERIRMEQSTKGIYVGYYQIGEREGTVMLAVELEDQFQNRGTKRVIVLIRGTSVWYTLDKNRVIVIPAALALLIALARFLRNSVLRSKKE